MQISKSYRFMGILGPTGFPTEFSLIKQPWFLSLLGPAMT